MPRPPHIEAAGGVHHVAARGNRKAPIFEDDHDRQAYIALLRAAARCTGWRCLAYCLMTNHLHLAFQTPKENLSSGMQWLHGAYGRWFNDRHGLTGHVFEGRFRSRLVADDGHLLELGRYLALNPVRAGLAARPGNWRWGSYGVVVGLRVADDFLDVERFLNA